MKKGYFTIICSLLLVFTLQAQNHWSVADNGEWYLTFRGQNTTTHPFSFQKTGWNENTPIVNYDPRNFWMDGYQSYYRIGDDIYAMVTMVEGMGAGSPDEAYIARYKGTTIDNLQPLPNGNFDSSFNWENGNSRYWLYTCWRDDSDGKLYGLVHVEYFYANPTGIGYSYGDYAWAFRKVLLATSTDNGLTWHNNGEVISNNYKSDAKDDRQKSFAGGYFNIGCGDPFMYVDKKSGYIYCWYLTGWLPKTAFEPGVRMVEVARCRIADKMQPGSWYKFYNGTWTQPGLKGKATCVMPNAVTGGVAFSTSLNKFICAGAYYIPNDNNQNFLAFCDDLEKQEWNMQSTLAYSAGAYNWFVNDEGTNWEEIGDDCRILSAMNDYHEYFVHTSNTPGTETEFTKQFYPFQPVDDEDAVFGRNTTIVDDADTIGISYSDNWKAMGTNPIFQQFGSNTKYFSDTWHESNVEGSWVKFKFHGSSFFLRAPNKPSLGIADLYIDDEFVQSIDFYNVRNFYLTMPYYNLDLTDAPHEVKLVVTGRKNSNAWSNTIAVDAFEFGAESHSAAFEFSLSQGFKNWEYGYYENNIFTPINMIDPELKLNRFKDGTNIIGAAYMAGVSKTVSKKWKAPHSGKILIAGDLKLETTGNPHTIKILKNTNEIWGTSLTNSGVQKHQITIEVQAGDEILFTVKGPRSNATLWNPTIQFLPEIVNSVQGKIKYEIQIYPNPIENNTAFVYGQFKGYPQIAVRVNDVLGHSYVNQNFVATDNCLKIKLPVLSSGLYFIVLQSKEYKAEKSFLVN